MNPVSRRAPWIAGVALAAIFAAAAGGVSAAPNTAPAAAVKVPPIAFKQRTLPNGLQLYTSVDRTTPNVTVQVWYGVGSKDDPAGRSGFAHLFEHMMFKATRDLPAESFDRLTEDVGGTNNAFTADDTTAYHEVIPANHLQRLIWAEAERMGSLVVDEANFKSERSVVEEELRQRVLADPYGRFFRLSIPQHSFTVHPYKRPGIGSIEDLEASTLDDVRAFHATYYRPDDAALIVVGNFDPAQLDAWVDQYFGAIKTPATPVPKVTAVEPPRTGGPKTFTDYGPNVPLPALAITWLAPAARDRDAAALNVLDAILTGGKSSRLYNALVYKQQLAAEVFSNADLRAQPGLFEVGMVMAGGKSLEAGEAALRAQVAAVRDKPVTAEELATAKTQLTAAAVRRRETVEGRAFELGNALREEGDAARANTDIADLNAVTAADVQRVAAKYLADDTRVVIRYLPESARPAGSAATAEAAAPPAAKPVESKPYTGEVATLAPEGQRQAPPPIGAPIAATLPSPAEKTLPNGLRVIVAHSSDLPLITANLIVKSGGNVDPPGLAGAADVTASLVTEGTATRTAPQIAQQVEALGAALNAGSGWESSSVTLSSLSDKIAPAMAIMADVAEHPAFAPDELERVRKQDLDGLAVTYHQPGGLAGAMTAPVVFAGTAFGHAADGTPGSLAKLSRDDVVALHRTYWRPDNAILVLTGDLTPDQGFTLAQQAFGDWARPASAAPAPVIAHPAAPPRAVAVDVSGAGQAAVVMVKTAITRADPLYYQGLVANAVLGGGYSARLNEEIRIKRGLSYGAGSRLSARATLGSFSAQAQTKNQSAGEVVNLLRSTTAGLATNAPAADELAARQSSLVGEYGRELATSGGLAGILGNLAVYGIDLNEIKAYTDRVNAVTAAQVSAFARDQFDPAKASFIVVGDAKVFLDPLKAALPSVEVIPVDNLDLDSPTLKKAP
ncbi:MAG: insulinase family protein [Proteobacteria bacterium]|nr:insulinase family protein [Pseudomonadota bacterium]